MTNPSIASDLIERLRQEYTRIPGTGSRLINPDGPEAADALEQLTREVDELRAAIAPFIEAGAHGVTVADAVRAANLPKAGLSPLMCPEIPAGVSAAQDRISFADWKSVAALSRSSGRVSDPKENNHG